MNPITTRAEAEVCLAQIAQLTNARQAVAVLQTDAIQAATAKHATELAELSAAVETHTARIEAWATANPHEFPADSKCLDLPSGRIGFRTSTPKLKTLAKWTWDKVLTRLKDLRSPYIRTEESVDKEALLKSELSKPELSALGVKIDQDENFYFKLKS